MAKIKQIHAREILDSRGNPTVEVDVVLAEFFSEINLIMKARLLLLLDENLYSAISLG